MAHIFAMVVAAVSMLAVMTSASRSPEEQHFLQRAAKGMAGYLNLHVWSW